MMRKSLALWALALATAPLAGGSAAHATMQAASPITVTNVVQVERKAVDAAGKETLSYEDTSVVVPGDRLLVTLSYRYTGTEPLPGFRITNPLDASMMFDRAFDGDASIVSVDGGKSWGDLANLTVSGANGTVRPAGNADVTHVRFPFAEPLAAGASGQRRFYAVVR